MGIHQDAGEILAYLYKKYIDENKLPRINELEQETKWGRERIIRAIEHLYSAGMIEAIIKQAAGGNKLILIKGITHIGINTVEDVKEFSKNFNFQINLGALKFSWGTSEK